MCPLIPEILLLTQLIANRTSCRTIRGGEGNRGRNIILKCEITRPITPITITNSWILQVV